MTFALCPGYRLTSETVVSFCGDMQPLPRTLYPDNEIFMLSALKALFEDWHREFVYASSSVPNLLPDEIVCDGFYPHYLGQKERILFVGRESRGLSGCNYIDVLLDAYRLGVVGEQHLNRSKFHSRMLRIAWGILHDLPPWGNIPSATKIAETFATAEGTSFAFMNLSKLSNEGNHWSSDWQTIQSSNSISSRQRNFVEEQIRVLKPSIVVAMNIPGSIALLGKANLVEQCEMAAIHRLESMGHVSKLLCTWHFAAPRKKADAHYYQPICDILRRHGDKAAAW